MLGSGREIVTCSWHYQPSKQGEMPPRVVVLRCFGSKSSALCVPRLAASTEQHFPEMSVWSGREEEMENAFCQQFDAGPANHRHRWHQIEHSLKLPRMARLVRTFERHPAGPWSLVGHNYLQQGSSTGQTERPAELGSARSK